MMNRNFDPYDVLMELGLRVERLEASHGQLINAHNKALSDLDKAKKMIKNLQDSHGKLHELAFEAFCRTDRPIPTYGDNDETVNSITRPRR